MRRHRPHPSPACGAAVVAAVEADEDCPTAAVPPPITAGAGYRAPREGSAMAGLPPAATPPSSTTRTRRDPPAHRDGGLASRSDFAALHRPRRRSSSSTAAPPHGKAGPRRRGVAITGVTSPGSLGQPRTRCRDYSCRWWLRHQGERCRDWGTDAAGNHRHTGVRASPKRRPVLRVRAVM